MFSNTLIAAVAEERLADYRHDAARRRLARRQVPAGITRRVPRKPHGAPARPGRPSTTTRAI